MSNIVINDLEVSTALDQQALSELTGGGHRWRYRKYGYYFKKLFKNYGFYKPYAPKYVETYYIKPVYPIYGYGHFC